MDKLGEKITEFPLVSVIIPTIGRESLLKTLESVINQTYKELEIIITDDTEEQRAFKLVEPFLKSDKRIRYVVNKKYKHGPTGNKNNGLDNISKNSKFFTFVDDDDIIFPDAIEKLVKIALSGDYKIVFANCIDQYGRLTGKHYGKSEEITYRDFLCGKYEGEYSGIIATEILDKDRLRDDTWGGESLLWFKLMRRVPKMYYHHEPLKFYRYEGIDSVTKKMIDFADRSVLNYFYTIKEFENDFLSSCPLQIIRFSVPGIYFSKFLKSKKYKFMFYFLKKSFKASKKYSLMIVLPWFILVLILPKTLVLKLWQKLSFLKKTLKNLFLRQ